MFTKLFFSKFLFKSTPFQSKTGNRHFQVNEIDGLLPSISKDIKKLEFSEKITENELSEKSFVQKFLQSVKQKMYSNRK